MISKLKIAALAAGAALASVSAPALAQFDASQGTAVINLDAAIVQSNAFKAAEGQIKTTYGAQITQVQTRQTALQTELTPLRTEIENLQKNPATPKATLDAKIAAFQTKAQSAQTELQRLAAPFARAEAYAKEQITAKLEPAVRAAMTAKKVSVALQPESVVLATPAGDLTPDVVTQLNALVPSVSITPPANWQPGQAQQAQGAPAGR
ncbi:OmpH family outer membrane protein [Sphingomonas montanisoli]|uniref:OmpH family outer membrane protein n=1 Tax=Sphingomonas montanisoli TaxID=2606412 RepID=A0A5D9CD63_9SPHN|nr:OmpH family outer membrane protein [Sphingomonas montanisoli]TZG29092.1 OmpH family outer membrane protein [Sphingomonas montanisoli]